MLNHVTIMGRLTRDPELRRTQAGTAVASFSLAVDRDFKDRTTGERAADFINVVAWGQSGEFVSRYFTKGRMAAVEGRLQARDWMDNDGNKRRAYEVVADHIHFCGDRPAAQQTQQTATPAEDWTGQADAATDAELPF